jgi:hypothetical protein
MKKRRVLGIEQLEARETPDVSLGHAGAYSLPSLPVDAAIHNGHLLPPSTLLPGSEQAYTAPKALPDLAHQAEAASYLQALERLFNEDFQHLVDRAAESLAQETPAATTEASANAQAVSQEQALQAWRFLSNYTRKAIRNEEIKYGGLPDHEDIIHQTFVEWRQQVGPQATPLANLLDKTSAERQVLQKTVRRVIDHTRYEQNRQKKMAELIDQAAPLKAGHQDWVDLRLDWAQGVGNLVPQELRMLELRSQGKTFEEIGSEIGLVKQRVYEMYHSTLDRLQSIYAS